MFKSLIFDEIMRCLLMVCWITLIGNVRMKWYNESLRNGNVMEWWN